MTFASFIHFQKHTSPKSAARLLTQDRMSVKVNCMIGRDEWHVIGRNSESDNLYLTNLPAC
ncbi:MAG: hypothetical protein JNL70_19860 [Saprospiraceae bacterium]|nr:hypothetical protein [Saprospiraceae bacterium]